MSYNSFGHIFRVTTWGESHGPALGCSVDGCPPGIPIDEAAIQQWLDKRKPGQNRYTTQRREADEVEIVSGVFEGHTTGTPVQLMIRNTDQRSKDYSEISGKFRPGHADITYWQKYGLRDYRGGGRSSARETAARVAAGGLARAVLARLVPSLRITGYMVQMGERVIDRARFDAARDRTQPLWVPDAVARATGPITSTLCANAEESVGAVIELKASGCTPRPWPHRSIASSDHRALGAAMLSINAVQGRGDLRRDWPPLALTDRPMPTRSFMRRGWPAPLRLQSRGRHFSAAISIRPGPSFLRFRGGKPTPRSSPRAGDDHQPPERKTEIVTKGRHDFVRGIPRPCRWAKP